MKRMLIFLFLMGFLVSIGVLTCNQDQKPIEAAASQPQLAQDLSTIE